MSSPLTPVLLPPPASLVRFRLLATRPHQLLSSFVLTPTLACNPSVPLPPCTFSTRFCLFPFLEPKIAAVDTPDFLSDSLSLVQSYTLTAPSASRRWREKGSHCCHVTKRDSTRLRYERGEGRRMQRREWDGWMEEPRVSNKKREGDRGPRRARSEREKERSIGFSGYRWMSGEKTEGRRERKSRCIV